MLAMDGWMFFFFLAVFFLPFVFFGGVKRRRRARARWLLLLLLERLVCFCVCVCFARQAVAVHHTSEKGRGDVHICSMFAEVPWYLGVYIYFQSIFVCIP